MKALIRIFLPLCIFSFVAFGISTAVLGVNPDYAHSELSATSGETSTTTLEGEFSSIDIDTGAGKVTLKPHSENYVRVTVDGQNYAQVNAKISGGTLKVYNEWSSGLNWFKRLFSGELFNSTTARATVLVPERVYDNLDISCGAGSISCDEIRALDVELDVSAGEIRYTQPEDFTAQSVDMEVSAGSLKAYNVQTEKYVVDVSAGSADVYGLTGRGDVGVSAGSAKVRFASLDGDCDVDVSAGEAILDIPEDASASIRCYRSAGDIKINAGGVNKSASDGETVTINGGGHEINADVSAGNIRIVNYISEDNAVTTMTGVAYVEPVESVGDIVGSAVEQAMNEVSNALDNL